MHFNPLSPSAIPKVWHSHSQTPQEEFDKIASMERQYRRDQVHALRTVNPTSRPQRSQCANPTTDKNNQNLLHHQQHYDPPPLYIQRSLSLMEIDNDNLTTTSQSQQAPRQSQIENHQDYNNNNDDDDSSSISSSRNTDTLIDISMLSGDPILFR